jgi:hypothetical protein
MRSLRRNPRSIDPALAPQQPASGGARRPRPLAPASGPFCAGRAPAVDRIPPRQCATIYKGVMPFILSDLVRLTLLVVFSILSTFLPSRM